MSPFAFSIILCKRAVLLAFWQGNKDGMGGVVEVTVTGKREVSKVKIDPEAVDPDDVEMLEDLIVAATNEALRKCEEESQAQMAKITGGLGGLGGGLF